MNFGIIWICSSSGSVLNPAQTKVTTATFDSREKKGKIAIGLLINVRPRFGTRRGFPKLSIIYYYVRAHHTSALKSNLQNAGFEKKLHRRLIARIL